MSIQEKGSGKLIEQYFPYSLVSEIAYKESNAKRFYRPVLTLGKWFARRLGSVFRSILIYAAKNKSDDVKFEDRLEREKFWNLYLEEHSFHDITILDPFMGGGTTIVEAMRLGVERIIGGDLNPIAWFIVKKEIEDVNIKDLIEAYGLIEHKLKSYITHYYKTRCEFCLNEADIMYCFWIKEINCELCSANIPLFRGFIFAYDKKEPSKAYFICPSCEKIFQAHFKDSIYCTECNYSFSISFYNVKHGRYFCSSCGHSKKIIEAISANNQLIERMYAIEYYCSFCNVRKYKKIDENDIQLFNKAYNQFMEVKKHLPIPNQSIPVGEKTQELLNHGFTYFNQMFNVRQLLCLGKLLKEIMKVQDANIREFLLITFIAALEYNNLLCEYHRKNHYIYNLFRKHAFPATLNPVENNVWGTKFGTGTFKNFFAKTVRIKKYCESPYESYITKDGKVKRKKMERSIKGNPVFSYSELLKNPKENVYIYCDSSQKMQIPDNAIDLVITDPPYYDNVQYSELSDFYYVWLHLALKEEYKWFQSPLTPKKDEIVKNAKLGKTTKYYQKGLYEVFKEVSRVLKPRGLLILTFHHKKVQAWNSLIQSLLENKFYITAVYPVRSEMKTSTQIRGTKSIEFDAIFICKKHIDFEEKKVISWENLSSIIEENVKEKISQFTKDGGIISFEDKSVIQIGVGLKFFSEFYPHIKHKGKNIPLLDVLEYLSSPIE